MTRLFGTNGIRGVVGPDMNADLALKVGRAIGTSFEGGPVALGRDTRLSGPMLARAAASGLMSAGCDVVDLGVVPTPSAQYFLAKSGHLKGGVVVTASHNPREFNGLKALDARGMEASREDEEAIESIFFDGRFRVAAWSEVGSIRSDDTANHRYLEAILAKVNVAAIRKSAFTVVVDPGNGAGCVVGTRVGSPIVARTMFETGAAFGGEENGGVIFPDHQFCRDGAMSAAKMLELLAHEGKRLSSLAAALPQYHLKKTNVSVPVERRDAVLASLVELTKGRKVDTTDGVKIVEADGAVLVRPSGTEPIFRVYAEGRTPERADALAAEGADLIQKALGRR